MLPSWTRHCEFTTIHLQIGITQDIYVRVSLPSERRNRRTGINNNWILPRNLVAAHPKERLSMLGDTFSISWRRSPRRFVVVHPAMSHGARATNGSFFVDGPSGGRVADVALALIPPSMAPPGHHDPLRTARLLTRVAARHVMAGTSVGRRLWTPAFSSRLCLPSSVHWLLVEPPSWLCFLGHKTYSSSRQHTRQSARLFLPTAFPRGDKAMAKYLMAASINITQC